MAINGPFLYCSYAEPQTQKDIYQIQQDIRNTFIELGTNIIGKTHELITASLQITVAISGSWPNLLISNGKNTYIEFIKTNHDKFNLSLQVVSPPNQRRNIPTSAVSTTSLSTKQQIAPTQSIPNSAPFTAPVVQNVPQRPKITSSSKTLASNTSIQPRYPSLSYSTVNDSLISPQNQIRNKLDDFAEDWFKKINQIFNKLTLYDLGWSGNKHEYNLVNDILNEKHRLQKLDINFFRPRLKMCILLEFFAKKAEMVLTASFCTNILDLIKKAQTFFLNTKTKTSHTNNIQDFLVAYLFGVRVMDERFWKLFFTTDPRKGLQQYLQQPQKLQQKYHRYSGKMTIRIED